MLCPCEEEMAVPLLTKKIVKKRVKKFKRPQSDRKICVKVRLMHLPCFPECIGRLILLFVDGRLVFLRTLSAEIFIDGSWLFTRLFP